VLNLMDLNEKLKQKVENIQECSDRFPLK